MARIRHTPEQQTAALAIYVTDGPAEAGRQTGIDKHTIASWARRQGLQTNAPANTRAAAETHSNIARRKRAELNTVILDAALAVAYRLDAPYEDAAPVPGRGMESYTLPLPPLQAVRHGTAAVAEMVKTLRLEEGESTSRQEVSWRDGGIDLDAELASFARGAAAAGSTRSVAEHGTTGAATTS